MHLSLSMKSDGNRIIESLCEEVILGFNILTAGGASSRNCLFLGHLKSSKMYKTYVNVFAFQSFRDSKPLCTGFGKWLYYCSMRAKLNETLPFVEKGLALGYVLP